MALELITEFDPFLAKHIDKNSNSGTTNYLSSRSTTCNKIIDLMAQKVRSLICDELKQSKYFSLIIYSTPDMSHLDQSVLDVRYVLNDGVPYKRFLNIITSAGHKAEQMFKIVTHELVAIKVNHSDCSPTITLQIMEMALLTLFIPR